MAGGAAAVRYTRGAIAFHWAIALLVIANLAIGLFHDAMRGWPAMPVHKSIGLTVLGLSIARLGWRLTHPAPPLPDDVPRWQAATAHGLHWLFYLFMLAMPLSGWIMSSAGDPRRPVSFFWLFDVPYIAPSGSPLGGTAHDVHQVMGWIWVWLLVLHVAAALKHHWLDRDAVLWRMLPGVRLPEGR